mmetsp:Transcript_4631/g.8878  ORF Transcript_4631/g.8878 Transcript_4631/m.8878 type:complete len:215 (-) Transcript_4631:3920-4564(-)
MWRTSLVSIELSSLNRGKFMLHLLHNLEILRVNVVENFVHIAGSHSIGLDPAEGGLNFQAELTVNKRDLTLCVLNRRRAMQCIRNNVCTKHRTQRIWIVLPGHLGVFGSADNGPDQHSVSHTQSKSKHRARCDILHNKREVRQVSLTSKEYSCLGRGKMHLLLACDLESGFLDLFNDFIFFVQGIRLDPSERFLHTNRKFAKHNIDLSISHGLA